jgi:hypothetical protein
MRTWNRRRLSRTVNAKDAPIPIGNNTEIVGP